MSVIPEIVLRTKSAPGLQLLSFPSSKVMPSYYKLYYSQGKLIDRSKVSGRRISGVTRDSITEDSDKNNKKKVNRKIQHTVSFITRLMLLHTRSFMIFT